MAAALGGPPLGGGGGSPSLLLSAFSSLPRFGLLDRGAKRDDVLGQLRFTDLLLAGHHQKASFAGHAADPPVELDIVGEILAEELRNPFPGFQVDVHRSP